MFKRKHGENPGGGPKEKKRKKWLLRIGCGIGILVACFVILDKGTALRLMMNPHVKKIIWVPGGMFYGDWDKGMLYSLHEEEGWKPAYGKDGIYLDCTRGCEDADVTASFNKKEQTVTFYNGDGEEQETVSIPWDSADISIRDVYYKIGMINVAVENGDRGVKYLNFRSNQVYDSPDAVDIYNEEEEDYGDGYISVYKNGLWGYIDMNGNERITPKYEYAGLFKNGMAPVWKADGSCVMINKSDIEIFSDELLGDDYNDRLIELKDGIVDREGNYIVRKGDYGDASVSLLGNSCILVFGEEAIRILDAEGTEKYSFGKLLNDGYEYEGMEDRSYTCGPIKIRYANPDGHHQYILLSPDGELIAEGHLVDIGGTFCSDGILSDSILCADGNDVFVLREGNEVIPIGVKKDESIYDDSGMVHFFTQSGEEFKLLDKSYQYKLYQLKEGRYYNFFDSSEGDFCKTVEEILPTVNSYSVASPKLLCMSNMLLDDFLSYVPPELRWSYVVVLK